MKTKIIRTSTVAMSLDILLKGQLRFLSNYYKVIGVSGNDQHLEIVQKREKIEVYSIKMERKISPFKDFISLIKLYKYLKKEKPSLIHSITPKAGLLTMVAGYFAKVPVRMHTFTGLIFPSKTGIMQKLLIQMDKLLCICATHIIPEGNGVKNDLISFKITDKPLKVLAHGNVNGIDLEYFNPNLSFEKPTELSCIQPNDFVFVFVGRLVRDKGIIELVDAFENVNKLHKNAKLLLVGPYEQDLDPLPEITLNKIRQNKNIIETGFQKDVRPYLKASHCFVFPSHREGFPNVVLQAGAMDLPCVVSNINGSNEIIIDQENGLIFEKQDTNALYKKMAIVIEDKSYYLHLQSNSRRLIASRFSQELVWNALLSEYQNALENV